MKPVELVRSPHARLIAARQSKVEATRCSLPVSWKHSRGSDAERLLRKHSCRKARDCYGGQDCWQDELTHECLLAVPALSSQSARHRHSVHLCSDRYDQDRVRRAVSKAP